MKDHKSDRKSKISILDNIQQFVEARFVENFKTLEIPAVSNAGNDNFHKRKLCSVQKHVKIGTDKVRSLSISIKYCILNAITLTGLHVLLSSVCSYCLYSSLDYSLTFFHAIHRVEIIRI